MIVRQRTHWLKMLVIWKGSVLKKIIAQLFIITIFSVAVYYFNGKIYDYKVKLNPTVFTLIGLALAIFMAFAIPQVMTDSGKEENFGDYWSLKPDL